MLKKLSVKFTNIICFFSLLILFIFIMPLVINTNIDLSKYNMFYKFSFFILILLFLTVIMFLKFYIINNPKLFYIDMITLFLMSILIRAIVVLFIGIDTNQISDFRYAFDESLLNIPLNSQHYAIFPSWAMYSSYLKFLNFLFGVNIINGIISNMFVSAISVILIYYIILSTTENRVHAYFSSLVYMLWPSNIYSIILLTPEYMNILFTLISSIIIFKVIKNKDEISVNKIIINSIICGFFLSISGFFKPIDKIIYITIFFIVILLITQKEFKLKNGLVFITSIFITSIIFTQSIFLFLDNYVGMKVNRDPKMHFLYIGLSPNGIGTWSEETSIYPKIVHENNFDFKKSDKIVKEKLYNEIININYDKIDFFMNKIKISWGSDIYPNFVDLTLSDNSPIKKGVWIDRIRSISEIYYFIMLIMFFLSNISNLFYEKKSSYWLSLYFNIIILGFFFLLCLSEVQDRYKLVIYPYISIVSGNLLSSGYFNKIIKKISIK